MTNPHADADYGLYWGKGSSDNTWWVWTDDGLYAYYPTHDEAEAAYLRLYHPHAENGA